MLRIYPVELAAELKTGSRLPTGEYTPPDITQLNSTQHVQFSVFFTKSVRSRRELVVNSIRTARRRRNSTRQSRRHRRCVLGLSVVLFLVWLVTVVL